MRTYMMKVILETHHENVHDEGYSRNAPWARSKFDIYVFINIIQYVFGISR
jgi:hypothetical protein